MPVIVKISTPKGDIRVRLYDETPQHRDNFVKLVNEGFYNGTLFHRVIKGFMIQGGDPDSIGAPAGKMLGTGGPGYNVPAEIVYPQLFHKRGALAAARQSDEVNPERESSGSQFYLVYGKVYTPQELKQMEKQMSMQQEQAIFNKLVQKNRSQILELRKARNQAGLQELQDQLIAETKKQMKELPAPKFTPEQQEAYTTVGGTPFLDNQYTVFGEVESGMEVVAEIQQCATLSADRPKEDISMTMTIEQ
ncbi:MAG: peptidylprolyl isomerase [Bacteroidaceae bacterium]|nr:peptidylprolyl isomerase [Bacteroidaceae bacterium]